MTRTAMMLTASLRLSHEAFDHQRPTLEAMARDRSTRWDLHVAVGLPRS